MVTHPMGNGVPYYTFVRGQYHFFREAFDTSYDAGDIAAGVGIPGGTVRPNGSPSTFSLSATAGGQLQLGIVASAAPNFPPGTRFTVTSDFPRAGVPDPRLVRWDDGTRGLFDPTGNAEDVARLYKTVLGREADAGGLYTYAKQVDDGTVGLQQVALALTASPEFIGRYGSAITQPARFVDQMYENTFGRTADPGGGYVAAINGGVSEAQIAFDISRSTEARLNSTAYAGDRSEGQLYRLYDGAFGRAPDPTGQAAFLPKLDTGTSTKDLAQTLLSSAEFAGTPGAGGDTTFVTQLYGNLLGRTPDAGGLAGYTAALSGGISRAQILADIANSSEARFHTASATHDSWVQVS